MSGIFSQNIIAIIWDFDKTLIPGYMEEPIFRHFGVKAKKFWQEVAGLPEFYKQNGLDLVSKDTLYLSHILTYVRAGVFKGLNNELLRKLGGELKFYPGIPEIFEKTKQRAEADDPRKEIKLEHYILSTGLRQMVLGSAIASHVSGVWGCEFIEMPASPDYLNVNGQLSNINSANREISDIGYALDNTTKTRVIFEVNKGSNIAPEIDVNAAIEEEDRRVPIGNMIYIADGPSDIPVFSVINKEGGRTFAVYPRGSEREFVQVNNLQKQGRVHSFGEADYTEGSKTYMWIANAIDEIVERITSDRAQAVKKSIGLPPRHFSV